MPMPLAAALSTQGQTAPAVEEVCTRALQGWSGAPDLAVVFFSPHHADAAETFGPQLRQRLGARCLLGCVGESIIGNDSEVEGRPAVSLWLGRWSKPVEVQPFHLARGQTPEAASILGWPVGRLGG